jgi:Type VI secretion system (T6SS), amidase effector protein 4
LDEAVNLAGFHQKWYLFFTCVYSKEVNMDRPSFISAWRAFVSVRVPVAEVGRKIGGNVQKNIELPTGGFENACPIRMSYVLNKTGFPIRKSSTYSTVSGADSGQYIFRIGDMMRYLERTFGKPDKTVRVPKTSDFTGMKGIIVVKGHGWGNAKGHVTLWDGYKCSDSCHLLHDPDNGTFIPETASIWELH